MKFKNFDLTKEKLKEYIKTFISKEKIKDELKKQITKNNFSFYNYFFSCFDNPEEIKNNKYLFDLTFFLILRKTLNIEEVIIFSENVFSFNSEITEEKIEKLVIFELDLFSSIEKNLMKQNKLEKLNILDKVKNIYFSNSNYFSYKDEENVKEEINRVLNLNNEEKELLKKCFEIENENYYKIFARINEEPSLIESNLSFSNFIYNYILGERETINSIFSDNFFYSFKVDAEDAKETRISFSDSMKEDFFFKKLFEKTQEGIEIFSDEILFKLKNIFVKSLNNITERTINY